MNLTDKYIKDDYPLYVNDDYSILIVSNYELGRNIIVFVKNY